MNSRFSTDFAGCREFNGCYLPNWLKERIGLFTCLAATRSGSPRPAMRFGGLPGVELEH
jgi:hypothetical protein